MDKHHTIRKRLTVDGQVMTYKEAAARFGISPSLIWLTIKQHRTNRLRSSWLENRKGGWPLGRPKRKEDSRAIERLNQIPGPTPYELALIQTKKGMH